jgi:hypothetical protein
MIQSTRAKKNKGEEDIENNENTVHCALVTALILSLSIAALAANPSATAGRWRRS